MQTSIFLTTSFSLLILNLTSCQQKTKENKPVEKIQTEHAQSKPPSIFQDSLYIHTASAISFEPDSIQLEKIRKITSDNEFKTSVHEYIFKLRNASLFLQQHWPYVKIISAKNYRYLVFKTEPQNVQVIDLDKMPDAWGMYLYKPGKAPRLIDMMSIDTDAPNYFSN